MKRVYCSLGFGHTRTPKFWSVVKCESRDLVAHRSCWTLPGAPLFGGSLWEPSLKICAGSSGARGSSSTEASLSFSLHGSTQPCRYLRHSPGMSEMENLWRWNFWERADYRFMQNSLEFLGADVRRLPHPPISTVNISSPSPPLSPCWLREL
jgi:hypothetical protein